MRTLDSTLLTAQQQSTMTPYVQISVVTAEGSPTTEVDWTSNDRLVYFSHHEELYAGKAEIWLRDNDQTLKATDYVGRRVRPYWGLVDAPGVNRAEEHPPLWIIKQRHRSAEGGLFLILECIDIWGVIGMFACGGTSIDAAPEFNGAGLTATGSDYQDTISEIIAGILSDIRPAGFTDSGVPLVVPGGSLDTSATWSTGIFKEYEPGVIADWGMNALALIRQVMDFTKCYLRMDADTTGMNVMFPDPGGAINRTWGTSPYFTLESETSAELVLPNEVIYVTFEPDKGGATKHGSNVATASNSTSQVRFQTVAQLFSPQTGTEVGNNSAIAMATELQQRADVILFNIELEADRGTFIARPVFDVELLDFVAINDDRSDSTTVTGRVGVIEKVMDLRPNSVDTNWKRYYMAVGVGL